MITDATSERLRRAGERKKAAANAVRIAESDLIEAEREFQQATKQWEREYFRTRSALSTEPAA